MTATLTAMVQAPRALVEALVLNVHWATVMDDLSRECADGLDPEAFARWRDAVERVGDTLADVLESTDREHRIGLEVWTTEGDRLTVAAGNRLGGFLLSSDGGTVEDGWHEGPSAEQVRYEVWSRRDAEGRFVRVAHGWRDKTSRKIVQVG